MSDNTLIASKVIAAFLSQNSLPASELPALIQAVVCALDNLGKAAVVEEPAPKLAPAVSIKKSIHNDYLISLEDGKRYKTLKRHLSSMGMSPDDYRAKWGLTADYPMVSAAYSAARSELSKALGLGRKKAVVLVEAPSTNRKARSKATAPVEAEASTTAKESVEGPVEAIQEAA